MKTEAVEIYSDATNRAVMRHPGRNFPGVLIQGDSLWSLCDRADALCKTLQGQASSDAYGTLNDLRNTLWSYLSHYEQVLTEHGIRLPYSKQP